MKRPFYKIKKTFLLPYTSSTTWRQVFLMASNPLHKKKEKFVYDRSSAIPSIYEGLRVHIYSGKVFKSKVVTRWMLGSKFGEFVWNRKLALYKAKQLKKKKNK